MPYVRTRGRLARQLLAPRIVDVDDRRRSRRQHLEQPPLGCEVLLHVAVEIEMIARQVREDARRESDAGHALQHQRMRRDFHRAGTAAAIDHFAKQPLHFRGFRRRVRCVALVGRTRPDANGDRADAAARHSRRVEHRGEQIRGRGLAVRAGDAGDRQGLARLVVDERRPVPPARAAHPACAATAHRPRDPAGSGVSATMAAAPRRAASSANVAPSARCPRIATNTTPGAAARESCVTPVTGRSLRPARSIRARASGASERTAAASAPRFIDRSHRRRAAGADEARRRRRLRRIPQAPATASRRRRRLRHVIDRPSELATRSASRRLRPRMSGMTGRPPT